MPETQTPQQARACDDAVGSATQPLSGQSWRLREAARRVASYPRALLIAPSIAIALVYGIAHYWLCDDAFISFRYARNLAAGHGLVFNVGERVEGYTNFLWVLELAALWKIFGVRPEHASVALSALFSAGTLLMTAMLARGTPFTRRSFTAVAAALLLLAVNRNFAVWSTSGLETRQFTLMVLLAILLQQRAQAGVTSYRNASLAWAGAALTRPDAQLLFACAVGWELARGALSRRFRLRTLAQLLGPAVLVLALHLLFRVLYYGEWLPNTYYAKHVRPWPEAGLVYLTAAVIENGLYVMFPLALIGAVARWVLGRNDLHWFTLAIIALHAGYWAWIGGDHFEFRPMDFYWPLLAVAAIDGWLSLETALRNLLLKRRLPFAEQVTRFASGVLLATVLVYSTVLQVAHAALTHDRTTRTETFRLKAEITLDSFPLAFVLPGLESLLPPYNAALRFGAAHGVGARWQEHRVFWRERERDYAAYGAYAAELFSPDMLTEMISVGVAPYHLGTLTVIDTLGLTDRTVARNPVTRPNRERQLAHDRQPPPGYLEQRGVNITVYPAARSLGAALHAAPYALQLHDALWMPISSPKPAWLERTFAARGLWHKHLSQQLKENVLIVNGRRVRGVLGLGFFDEGLEGWSAHGEAMRQPSRRPVPRQAAVVGTVGAALINSFHEQQGDAATGELWSPPFVPQEGDLLAFLLGGGGDPRAVGVELLCDGNPVRSWTGNYSERLDLMVHDLAAHAGERCQIRIYDHARGAWGHILADHFMLAR